MGNTTQEIIRQRDVRRHANYVKVRDWLLDYIAEHDFKSGERLPSERMLGEALGFSRNTIAKGVAQLVDEGILVRRPRSGTFIGGAVRNEPRSQNAADAYVIGVVMPWLGLGPAGEITGEAEPKVQLPFKRRGMAAYVAEGILGVAKEHDCRLVIRSYANDITHYMMAESMPDEHVDGWIVIPDAHPQVKALYSRVTANGTPIVFVDQYLSDVPSDYVVTDNFGAAWEAVRYLIEKGHRRIAYFTDFICASSVTDREAGYRAALEEANIPYDEEIVRSYEVTRANPWSFDLALKHCRSLPDPITAVFCVNDDALLAALQAAGRWGMAVPDDIELVGFFDDHVPDWAQTPFTRVVQDTAGMGSKAMELLLDRLSGKAGPEPRRIALPARLVPDNVNGLLAVQEPIGS